MKRQMLKFLIALTSGGILAAFLYFQIPEPFQVSSIVEIGGVGGQAIQDPQVVIGRIKSDYSINSICKQLGTECDDVAKVKKSINLYQVGGEGVYIACKSATAADAIRICELSTHPIIRDHKNRLVEIAESRILLVERKKEIVPKQLIKETGLINEFADSQKRESRVFLYLFISYSLTFFLIYFRRIVGFLND
jgi:hypothetical protein